MSQLLINQYLADLSRLRRVSGADRETVVREAFKDLLKAWGRSLDLQFIPEHEYITPTKERRYIDGALLHDLRVPFGYWEAKDSADDLDEEIARKFRRGYPRTNIIFEDSKKGVLIQGGREIMRCPVDDVTELQKLLGLFFSYERPEIADFRAAVAQFKNDLPEVLKALRQRIDDAYAHDRSFATAAGIFLKLAQETINPAVSDVDVREMLIQHILTEDIFARVFGNDEFHRENNVAKSLYDLERLFFRGDVKQRTLAALEPYYAAIRSTAALIQSHSEKQGFLKAIYENFYKVYNPKAADRLGVIYTPNPIVRFMVRTADWLCEQHFNKNLIDRDVEILDPATGTGTFIVELLEHFRGRPTKLQSKYRSELHANEVAILPYYVANLNIEATYAAITSEYLEFPNLCFVDTLDNTAALTTHIGQHYGDLLGGISMENVERIHRQNSRKISVIIGNPPYNANQQSENDNNKNRTYPEIDQRIRATYVRHSQATRPSVYDMYARFFRWASDRLPERGILAFVSNRSFISSRAFDGFRYTVSKEFAEIWIVDLGGDIRANPKLSGTRHNVFGIQTGVAISFLVKRPHTDGFRIHYARRPEFELADEKLAFLGTANVEQMEFAELSPDADMNWLYVRHDNFSSFIAVDQNCSKGSDAKERIFDVSSTGIMSGRDEWVYDFSAENLDKKKCFFIKRFSSVIVYISHDKLPNDIKWSRNLIRKIGKTSNTELRAAGLRDAQFRPFTKKKLVDSDIIVDELGALKRTWVGQNIAIAYLCVSSSNPLCVLAVSTAFDYGLLKQGNGGTHGLYRYWYDKNGAVHDNITDWGHTQFKQHYPEDKGISKDDIFAYIYAVMHDPNYKDAYEVNLKRLSPRIPFYRAFKSWRDWGRTLLDLHLGYETVEPFPMVRIDLPDEGARAAKQTPRVILKSEQDKGIIVVDSETQLSGVPATAWNYRLGNRSAIDWVLDQHKERKSRDFVIQDRFNVYKFADHKEQVIDMLRRIVTVSLGTVKITEAMRSAGH